MNLETITMTLNQIFDRYAGADGDCSSLSQPELLKMCKAEFPTLCKIGTGDEVLKKICSSMDLDGNKSVDFQEFAVFVAAIAVALKEATGGKGCHK
ncbi:protein S100-G-like [Ambystoma mexicanum]|uniref:protein S100-G-like n=1 Tax=Ambystoma mexicanum TaxID=8296 RepID=UPI0037E95304